MSESQNSSHPADRDGAITSDPQSLARLATSQVDTSLPASTDSSIPQDDHYISSYLYQISYAADDDPFSDRRRPITTTSLSDARQQLIEACIDYVFNSLPTHLVRIADMTIVTRNEIWEAERSRIENVLDDELREMRYEYSKGLGWHFTGFLERSWCEVSPNASDGHRVAFAQSTFGPTGVRQRLVQVCNLLASMGRSRTHVPRHGIQGSSETYPEWSRIRQAVQALREGADRLSVSLRLVGHLLYQQGE